MFHAQMMIVGSTPSTAVKVYSPWFARQGDYLRATAELGAVNGATITVKVFHKNQEDPGNGGENTSGSAISLTTAGVPATSEWNGMKELVRYEFSITGTASGQWALFRVLTPVWFDAVKA